MTNLAQFHLDNVALDPYELDPDTVLDGTPQLAFTVLWRSADGTAISGLFSSTVGKFTVEPPGDESNYVRKGRMIVTSENGSQIDCGPGDVLTMMRGATYTLEVLEDFENYFVVCNPNGVEV